MAQSNIYSDLNLGLINPDTEILKDTDAIKQQLLLRLLYVKRSRVMKRDFGSKLEQLLYEPLDATSSEDIRREIINLVGTDGRLVINKNEVIPDIERQQYYVDFELYCPALKQGFNLNFNLAQRGKNG